MHLDIMMPGGTAGAEWVPPSSLGQGPPSGLLRGGDAGTANTRPNTTHPRPCIGVYPSPSCFPGCCENTKLNTGLRPPSKSGVKTLYQWSNTPARH